MRFGDVFHVGASFGYWETWKRCGQNVMFLVCPSSNKKIYADMKFPLREAKLFTK